MPIILNVSESSSFCPHLPADSDLRSKKKPCLPRSSSWISESQRRYRWTHRCQL